MASFPKQMRITNETQLQTLFESGKNISSGGITLKYIQSQVEFKVGFSAPKRLHATAVTRNLLKRRMRESFRLQKHILGNSFCGVGYFLYTKKEVKSSNEIYRAFTALLAKWRDCET
ncbi:MAG: ribonuclease P protein component [Flavobacteriaceae bacterium]|nr:ribonuclease P protein component [Flavobacteriaceae bacterium]